MQGFVLMHKGGQKRAGKDEILSRRNLARDPGISLLDTGLIVALVKLKVLQPIGDSLKPG